jgi:hypothetical protein
LDNNITGKRLLAIFWGKPNIPLVNTGLKVKAFLKVSAALKIGIIYRYQVAANTVSHADLKKSACTYSQREGGGE